MKLFRIFISFALTITFNITFAQLPVCPNPLGQNLGSGTGIDSVWITNFGNFFGHGTPIEEGYTNEADSPGVNPILIQRGEPAQLRVSGKSCGTGFFKFAAVGVWIDWNGDGDFTDSGDTVGKSAILNFNAATNNFTPPSTTTLGNKRMRIIVDSCGTSNTITDPCVAHRGGDVEDYMVLISDQNQTLDTIIVSKDASKKCYSPLDTQNYVLKMQLNTRFGLNLMDIQSFTFNLTGSNNISSLELWDGGNMSATGPVSLINSTTTILPATTIGTSQILTNDKEHYFYLVAVVASGATGNSIWDVGLASIDIDTGAVFTYNVADGSPSGTFRICGPEICSNGIDDDGDGLVDCFDSDCYGIAPCGAKNNSFFGIQSCFPKDSAAPSIFGEQLKWESSVTMSPMGIFAIGDIDMDCMPEVVIAKEPGVSPDILILDGKTGLLENTITFPGGGAADRITIGDVDGDDYGEIFISTGSDLACLEHDGSVKWGPINIPGVVGPINIADFNLDGNPEIYVSNMILDANTGTLLINGALFHKARGAYTYAFPVAVDILPDTFCLNCAGLELVVGDQVLSVDLINQMFNVAAYTFEPAAVPFMFSGEGWVSIADINNDGRLDILVTSNSNVMSRTYIYAWDPITGSTLAPTITLPAFQTGGRTCIGNFDADPELEIAYARTNFLQVIEHDFTLKWQVLIDDASGAITPVAMDIDGDDTMELIIRDQSKLKIYNSSTGALKSNIPCGSGTGVESPLLADVNNDGEANIACICSPVPFPTPGSGIGNMRLYESGTESWVPTRKVWNQHSYFATNINDNLSVPIEQQNHSQIIALNGFLTQTPLLDSNSMPYYGNLKELDIALSIIDVTVLPSCDTSPGGSALIILEYCNYSIDCELIDSIPITIYSDNPLFGGTVIYQGLYLNGIPQNTCVSDTLLVFFNNNTTIYAYANDLGTNPSSAPVMLFQECEPLNNSDATSVTLPLAPAITQNNINCNQVQLAVTGGDVFLWAPTITLTDSTAANPIAFLVDTFQTYTVSVTDTTTNCLSILSITVDTNSCDTTSIIKLIYIPNAFSPNGDEINDLFYIRALGIADASIKIYNRWGMLVYETLDPINNPWDGLIKSNPANKGVYVYVLQGAFLDSSPIDMKGNITLIN